MSVSFILTKWYVNLDMTKDVLIEVAGFYIN